MILKHRENHLRHFWPTSLVRTYFQTYGRWVPLLKRLLKTNQFLSKMQINFRFFFRFDFQAQRLSFLAITMLIKCFGSHRPTHYIHSNSTKSCSCENKQDDLGRILPCLFYRFLHFFFFGFNLTLAGTLEKVNCTSCLWSCFCKLITYRK